ncbi:ABC transporter ATP-binding protein [Pseudodesulfovibrio sp.]|uniref:ABC transporter ATP-binding protein n=1 Tax=unclassified Pseudodesulfovibrio TaxID=2661612 RepID=UPI003AFFAA33
MLRGEGISFHYENAPWIFRKLDFTMVPGEVVGLPGPSGRGKSTLGKVLAGHLAPLEGTVTCDDTPLPTKGYCPVQLLFQHPELTMNPRWKLGDSVNEGYTPDITTLRGLNIEPSWLARYPHELSGGELQRLALARVMSPATCYLIADEMTAMLDPNTQAMVWEVVLRWARKQNVGVLAISHDPYLLERVADRIDNTFSLAEEFSEEPPRQRTNAA